ITAYVRCGRRLYLDHRSSVNRRLFQSESRACRYVRIDLERKRGTTDGVVNTVQHVYDALDLADRIGHLRSPVGEKVGILSKELNLDRFGRAGEVSDHVLQDLDKLHVQRGFLGFDFA